MLDSIFIVVSDQSEETVTVEEEISVTLGETTNVTTYPEEIQAITDTPERLLKLSFLAYSLSDIEEVTDNTTNSENRKLILSAV